MEGVAARPGAGMNRALSARLSRLEVANGRAGDIPVWCEEPEDFEVVVDEMIAMDEIAETDRPRCKPWWLAQIIHRVGAHEAWIASLEDSP
jgi:hypothetical protein